MLAQDRRNMQKKTGASGKGQTSKQASQGGMGACGTGQASKGASEISKGTQWFNSLRSSKSKVVAKEGMVKEKESSMVKEESKLYEEHVGGLWLKGKLSHLSKWKVH